MKIFPVIPYCQFLDYSEKDYHALKISGDIKETMTCTLKWCKVKRQNLAMDKVKLAKMCNQASLKFLNLKELHHQKWDMSELYLLIADGRKEVNKDSMTIRVSCPLMLEIHQLILVKKAIFKIKKTSLIRLNKIKK